MLGIAARNGIMLVSHYRHLEESEGVPFGRGLVLRGASERLAPIVMTALATGLALAINPSRDIAPYLLTAIGSIPAAAGAVIALEATTPQAKPRPRLALAFNGVYGTF